MEYQPVVARRPPLLVRRRRALALGALSVLLLASASYWLASSGSTGPSIGALPGASSSGAVAEVTPMSSSVTRTNGGAQLQIGVALAKLTVAAAASAHIRVDVAWTNVTSATKVLLNPNAQISIGLYHPIHTGNCVSASNTTDAPLVNLADTDSASYCAALDQAATGSGSVSATGKLLLAQNLVSGFLVPGLDGSGAISACASAANDSGGWCQPASVTSSNQRALYVIASITTPGGIPQGQQAQLSSLTFFVQARRLS